MEYKKSILFIGLGVVLLFSGAANSQGQKEVPAKGAEERVTTTTEPKEDFQKARESFIKKDLRASAEAIRKAAAYFATLEGRAEVGREQAFQASQEELRRLAGRVEKGTVKSVKELDQVFARASHALAKYHYLNAAESWGKKETAKVGQELEAASTYLESGVKQAKGKVKGGVGKVIEHTHLIAGKLVKGSGWVNVEVEKGLKTLGAEIDRLGKKVKASKK